MDRTLTIQGKKRRAVAGSTGECALGTCNERRTMQGARGLGEPTLVCASRFKPSMRCETISLQSQARLGDGYRHQELRPLQGASWTHQPARPAPVAFVIIKGPEGFNSSTDTVERGGFGTGSNQAILSVQTPCAILCISRSIILSASDVGPALTL